MGDINFIFKKIFATSSFVKGSYLQKFEYDFAKFIAVKQAIGVASGTDALQLCLMALDIKPNDEVILPVNTFVATAYAVLYVGAKPIFIDTDPKTYNFDVTLLEAKITKKTRAIIPVHLYGQPAEMHEVLSIAKKYNLAVLEDASQAHGSYYKNKRVGSLGTLAAFSLYPSKNFGACGDGGIITTNSSKLANRLLSLREYGGVSKYFYKEVGLNSRLDALQAAILSIKLQYLDSWNKKRQKVASYYTEKINREVPSIITPWNLPLTTHVYYTYTIRVQRRDELMRYLDSFGIQTGIYYPFLLHQQKSLSNLGYKQGDFPVAESINKEILSLPIFPELTKTQQDYIIDAIVRFHEKN